MAVIITWSDEAKNSFDDNIKYLEKEWSEKEIIKFLKSTNQKLLLIKSNPKIYRLSPKSAGVRKVNVNKYISLFYKYYPRKNQIIILAFWHSKQNPKKSKY